MSGCSSSTSPSTSGGGSAGGLTVIPLNINFGSLPIGQSHDTTISLVNSGTSFVIITSDSVSSAEVSDSNFVHPVLLAAPSVTTIHLQFNPSAAGTQTGTDRINYTVGGTNASVTITLTATGVAGSSASSPNPGSTFTYAVDTSGVSQGDSTYTVVSNSLTFHGKTNVLEVRGPTGNLNYYHFESNGDIAVFVDLSSYSAQLIAFGVVANIPSTWVTIPLGSKQPVTGILFDSTLTIQSLPVSVIISDTGLYIGTSSVTAAGNTFQTVQGSMSIGINATLEGLISVISAENVTEVWFSNSLGFYPKRQDVQSSTQSTGGTGATTSATTTNYKLVSFHEN